MKPTTLSLALALACVTIACAEDLTTPASQALDQAVTYLRTKVAYGGGYLGTYKADLSDQWGETHATRTQNWIQPPGSPSVGFAFLRAWEATGEAKYLAAAKEVGDALVAGQLASGGWDYIVDHDPAAAKVWAYRKNRVSQDEALKKGRGVSTFDDNTTQHATRLLMALDKALERKDAAIHEAALAALELFLTAQHESGGWPQRYPPSGRSYSDFLTFNDDTISDCVDVMMLAAGYYGDPRYRDSVRRCGDFILRVQLPEPQGIWAQQYDLDLQPAWARRFEPAAACAYESVGGMQTLLKIAAFLQDDKYLAALPRALDWYKRSALPDGTYARFYELKTNRPLYMTKDYKLTYDGSDCPTHYSFKGMGFPRAVENRYAEVQRLGLAAYVASLQPKPLTAEQRQQQLAKLEPQVQAILAARDAEGRWVDKDGMLDMAVWERNIERLATYLKLTGGR